MISTYHSSKNASLYEPRIVFIKRLLESLLAVVDLESQGEIVRVDGFRLKNLQDWLVHSSCDPAEIFEYAGTRCDCDCLFCYNKGVPAGLALINPPRPIKEEFNEVITRLKFFWPRAELNLFPSLGSTCEIFIQPYVLDILKALRTKTDRCFRIPTNGTCLNSEMIEALSELKPIYLDLSLNSASRERRQRLMRPRGPDVAIEALPLLAAQGIPYSVVIVPWPVNSRENMLADLENTVSYADSCGAHLVQVSLPGYTRYFTSQELFNLDELWTLIVSRVRDLRSRFHVPVVVMPTMYEENIYENTKNMPRIIGVVKNSPASRGGLLLGDIITSLNGLAVHNRPQARDLLALLQHSDASYVSLVVERDGRLRPCELDLEDFSYPYSKETDSHLGHVFLGTGLRLGYIERMRDIIRLRQVRKVLVLSSKLVKPTLEHCLRETGIFGSEEFHLEILVPENRFFGGNIFMGDLLVVQDFIDCLEAYVSRTGEKPDLAIIPSSPFNLNHWGRDLTGRVYLDIERKTGIPVELLPCATIYD